MPSCPEVRTQEMYLTQEVASLDVGSASTLTLDSSPQSCEDSGPVVEAPIVVSLRAA